MSSDPRSDDLRDLTVLDTYLGLTERIGALKKAIKDAEVELDALAYAKYPKLSEPEIKTLVVEDKWLAAIETDIHGEMDRISQALTQRVKELTERYETPLPILTGKIADLSAKVEAHLKTMGFEA